VQLPASAERVTAVARAGCRKSARPVRRGGSWSHASACRLLLYSTRPYSVYLSPLGVLGAAIACFTRGSGTIRRHHRRCKHQLFLILQRVAAPGWSSSWSRRGNHQREQQTQGDKSVSGGTSSPTARAWPTPSTRWSRSDRCRGPLLSNSPTTNWKRQNLSERLSVIVSCPMMKRLIECTAKVPQ
jgi:hypothetical protein